MMKDLALYKDKKVLVTGNTGFKGSWLCKELELLGAKVTGYANGIPTDPALFGLAHVGSGMNCITADVRDMESFKAAFDEAKPEIVIHMVAQPLVFEGYREPVSTYETNVMGTVNLLECVRMTNSVKSVIIVTTDKVYKNKQQDGGYRETDELDGADPYSNSKSCAELITSSYRKSFLKDMGISISTARAGNSIGGGDFSEKRIIPDCIRAAWNKEKIEIRHPKSIRPYQHVLEATTFYLLLALVQMRDPDLAGAYNVGPRDGGMSTEALVKKFCEVWEKEIDQKPEYEVSEREEFPEIDSIELDVSLAKENFSWESTMDIEDALEEVVLFEKRRKEGKDLSSHMEKYIRKYWGDL